MEIYSYSDAQFKAGDVELDLTLGSVGLYLGE